jgi:beta-lactamase regulating signal transducer with metallopeptidase domain
MKAMILFPLLAALAVWWMGRRDTSRDPRLTALAIALLALLPVLLLLPKIPLLPPAIGKTGTGEPPAGWLHGLFAVWLAGCGVGWIRLGLSAIGLVRWRRQSTLVDRIAGTVEIRELAGLRGPVAAGVFRKMIFVPPGWHAWDEETRDAVLLHELAHHRRRDPLIRWLAAFACTFHWFNPLAHWMRRRLILQCEQACDEKVVATGLRANEYAEILCRFASHRPLPVAGLAMAEKSSLETRVRHLMAPSPSKGFSILAVLAGFVLWGALLLALLGPKSETGVQPDQEEINLRLTADPFPADQP